MSGPRKRAAFSSSRTVLSATAQSREVNQLIKQIADRLIAVDAADGFAQERGDGDDSHVREHLFGAKLEAVRDDDLFDRGFAQAFGRLATEDGVSRSDVDATCTVLRHCFDGSHNRTGRRDHVVKNECDLPFNGTADQVLLASLEGIRAALIDNREAAAEMIDVLQRSLDAPFIGANDDEVLLGKIQRPEVLVEDRSGVEVIDGAIEEALNLSGMEVHCQHAVGTGFGDEIRDQLRRDRDSAHVLAILPCVAEVGHDGGDASGTCSLASIDQDQQLHQVFVDGRAGRLDEEDITPSHVLIESNGDFSIRKIPQFNRPQIDSKISGDLDRKRRIRSATQDAKFVVHE